MTDQTTIDEKILDDVLTGAPFDPYALTPPRSIVQAYATQDTLIESLTASGLRGQVAGWKIAANSPQLMARFKLDEPATGRVMASQRHKTGVTLKAGHYTEFAFEPEIAAIMKTTLEPATAPFSCGDVIAAIDRFVPGIELLDMRNTDMPNTHIPDAIAQNISNVGAATGGPGIEPGALTSVDVHTVVKIDGKVVHDVTGAAPQDPVDAVTWLANHLALRGFKLEAGHVAMCGTHSPIWYHAGPGKIEVSMSGLGTVMINLI